jgi:hypothetical protein
MRWDSKGKPMAQNSDDSGDEQDIERDEGKFDYSALERLCAGRAAGTFAMCKRPERRTGAAWFQRGVRFVVVWGTLTLRGVFEVAVEKEYNTRAEAVDGYDAVRVL